MITGFSRVSFGPRSGRWSTNWAPVRYTPGQAQKGALQPAEASQTRALKPIHASAFRGLEAYAPESVEGPPGCGRYSVRHLVDTADHGLIGPRDPPKDHRDNPQLPEVLP